MWLKKHFSINSGSDTSQTRTNPNIEAADRPNRKPETVLDDAIEQVSQLCGRNARSQPNIVIHSKKLERVPEGLLVLDFVRRIDLSFNDLSVLPQDLQNMQSLRHVVLSGNKFSKFPEVLSKMALLQTVVLSKNKIADLPKLDGMSELRELDLFMNKIHNLDQIGVPPKISVLQLRANRLKVVPELLAKMGTLTHLDVSNNQIESLAPCLGLNLQKLECTSCNLSSLDIFCDADSNLSKTLTHFHISRNKHVRALPDLPFPLLVELRAAHCSISTITPLSICSRLKILDLDGNPVPHVQLACSKVEQLGLCNTHISKLPVHGAFVELAAAHAAIEILPDVADMPDLKRLFLQNNHISAVPTGFLSTMKNLMEFSLRSNNIMTLFEYAAFGSSLVSLDLACNTIHKLPMKFLSSMPHLERLDLAKNNLVEFPPDLWFVCTRLMYLNVFDNCITRIPSDIRHLQRLHELYAGNNKIVDLPQELMQLPSLQILHVAGNFLRNLPYEVNAPSLQKLYAGRNQLQEFPSSLSSSKKLETLDLSGNNIQVVVIAVAFPSLQELVLSHNRVMAFDVPLGAAAVVPSLVCLDLSSNPLSIVPPVGNLPHLEIVNLLYCDISHLSRKQLQDFSKISLIYMQGNPIEKTFLGRSLRVSFVEKQTDLLMSDLYKTANTVALVNRMRDSSTEAQSPFIVSWSEIKGARSTQEDTISIRSDLVQSDEPLHLFAVFDGHRGSDVSKFSAVQFPNLLRQYLCNSDGDTVMALRETFRSLSKSIEKAQLRDGATAAVALVLPDAVAMAHLGDARVVLFAKCDGDEDEVSLSSSPSSSSYSPSSLPPFPVEQQTKSSSPTTGSTPPPPPPPPPPPYLKPSSASHHLPSVQHVMRKSFKSSDGQMMIMSATVDHTAKNRRERRRVERELGGYVSDQGHVMGDIAVTRALGDVQFSPFVTNEPSVVLIPRTKDDLFMVVACDGLWDCMSNEDAFNIIQRHLRTNQNPSEIALMLRDYAISMGSSDNISVLVVLFRT